MSLSESAPMLKPCSVVDVGAVAAALVWLSICLPDAVVVVIEHVLLGSTEAGC